MQIPMLRISEKRYVVLNDIHCQDHYMKTFYKNPPPTKPSTSHPPENKNKNVQVLSNVNNADLGVSVSTLDFKIIKFRVQWHRVTG